MMMMLIFSRTHLFLFLFLHLLFLLPSALSNPLPVTPQSQSLFLNQSRPATIPAFPEQSNSVACSLHLPDEFFPNVKSACSSSASKDPSSRLHYTRCCPVLAAWLYSAYSATALDRLSQTTSYDMPLMPDDSESCVDDLNRATLSKGMKLVSPNETCDLVYCYCGIRLHPLTCPESFSVNGDGKLVGHRNVEKLERDCSSNGKHGVFPGLGGCSNCLKSLHLLYKDKTVNTSQVEDRTNKMRERDCQLMGLTWLLAKDQTTYIHTVSAVLRAMMTSKSRNGSRLQSCTLTSDGMPLAVDSTDINGSSSTTFALHVLHLLWFLALVILVGHY